jgi:hypothetical protein
MRNIAVFFVCAALAGSAMAQPESGDSRKQAEAFFAKLDAATNNRQIKALESMFAGSYYWVGVDGKGMNRAQMMSGMANWLRGPSAPKSKTNIKNVQLQSQELVVWTEQIITFKDSNGKPVKETTRWAETLVWINGGWKFGSSQGLPTNEPWSFKTNG